MAVSGKGVLTMSELKPEEATQRVILYKVEDGGYEIFLGVWKPSVEQEDDHE